MTAEVDKTTTWLKNEWIRVIFFIWLYNESIAKL